MFTTPAGSFSIIAELKTVIPIERDRGRIMGGQSIRAPKLLAWNLRRLRVAHGLSQKRLAANAHIARGYLCRIERGLENPTLEMLDRLAVELSIAMAELFVDPGTTQVPQRPLRGGRPRKLRAGRLGSGQSPPKREEPNSS